MPRGGFRVGAGRPRKDSDPFLLSLLDDEPPAVAFEFLVAAVRNPGLPFADRLRAASLLLPYERRRGQPLQPLGRKELAAEAAELAALGVYAPSPPPKPYRSV